MTFNPKDHLRIIANRPNRVVGDCPDCPYVTPQSKGASLAVKALAMHHQDKHSQSTEPDTRTAEQRVEDAAFENRIRRLIADHKWDELAIVLLVYGSAVDERGGPPSPAKLVTFKGDREWEVSDG